MTLTLDREAAKVHGELELTEYVAATEGTYKPAKLEKRQHNASVGS